MKSTVCSLETDKCVMIPVIHILQHTGCLPKPVPSFACIGKCSSYVQVMIKEFNVNFICFSNKNYFIFIL
uniref:DAN domain-containing protein n=1 Tax=Trichogramma kaykai TaxID=54128 RepID=A0ABD2VW70_9HYME